MAELSTMRPKVIKNLKWLDAKSIENKIGSGTPDVNCIPGWMELKWLRAWPERADTVVALRHYTLHQKMWLRRRWRAGGGAWLLLQCRSEWLLFDAPAAQLVGQLTRQGLLDTATDYWKHGLKGRELGSCLIRDNLRAESLAENGGT